jgi:hypothetical protein
MSTLERVHESFQNHLLNRDISIHEHILQPTIGTKDQRLDIYYKAYRLRIQEALSAHYPMLLQYLGQDSFSALCEDYITTYPSAFRSICCVGHNMPCFLKTYPLTQDKPYLSELAVFEWTLTRVFEAKESLVLQVSDFLDLSPQSWEVLCLHPHPSLHCLTFFWNAIPLWKDLHDKRKPLAPHDQPRPTTWVVWRKNFISYFISLSEAETAAFSILLSRQTFGTVCQELCSYFPENEVGMYAAKFLKKWVSEGFFTSFSLEAHALE